MKSAIVIGGSRGIGAAIVERLAQDGFHILFTHSSSAAEAEALAAKVEARGGNARSIQADNANPQALATRLGEALDRIDSLDVLVCNAGIFRSDSSLEYALEMFQDMIDVNVKAHLAAIKCCLDKMTSGSSIVMIGSVAGESSRFPGSTFYAMTKAALGGLVRGLARDLGPRGIRINLVQPGPIATNLTAEPAVQGTLKELTCLGRLGKPEEVAGLVAYVSGPEAGFITGATLGVDGGYLA